MEAILLVGIQASGKTTFYEKRFLSTHTRISLDLLKTRSQERKLLDSCLAAGRPFVVDNTNVTVERRAAYIAAARAAGFRVIGYFFRTPIGDALRRNKQRVGSAVIPAGGLFGTQKRLQPPRWAEGFDELHAVEILPDNSFRVTDMPLDTEAAPGA
jgi:predicted kinase